MTRQQIALQAENQCLPPLPQQPEIPERFRQQTPEEAVGSAKADFASLQSLTAAKKKCNAFAAVWCIVAALLLAGLAAVWFMELFPETLVLLCAGGVIVLASIIALCVNGAKAKRLRKEKEQILSRHPHMSPDNWVSDAEDYAAKQASYAAALAQAQATRGDLDARTKAFSDALADFAGDEPLQDMIQRLENACDALDALDNARRDLRKAEDHVITVQAMARTAQAPDFPDELELSEAETDELLSRASFVRQQLQHKLGQAQGRAEALGQEANIRNQLKVENRRIEKLEDTYNALELALNVLSSATRELQRRFAPRITKRAQELFGQLTGGRYDKLMLGEDLSLSASTVEDTGLRSAQYRSDGTVDQLYLALRLAVAEELTPEAPLVLDDALVRFDDRRAAVAMDILREIGDHKQVILFTCQSRDNQL
jgi:DNA repair exonuclease SbcCD ATPase subunit